MGAVRGALREEAIRLEGLPTEYMLEILEPDTSEDVVATFKGFQPFQTISVGDLINPRLWEGRYEGSIYRVVGVEHMIWEAEDMIKHKIVVFTEPVPDTYESRRLLSR